MYAGREGGAVLIYFSCWPVSLLSFLLFFLPKIRGVEGPPGPSPRSATVLMTSITKCLNYLKVMNTDKFC